MSRLFSPARPRSLSSFTASSVALMVIAILSVVAWPNAAAQTIAATIPIPAGQQAFQMAVNPATNKIYVYTRRLDGQPESILVIDGNTNAITPVMVGTGGSRGIAVNPVTNLVYVLDTVHNTVSVINGANDQVIGAPIPVPGAAAVVVNDKTNKIYVKNGGNTVSVIDGATNAVSSLTLPEAAVSLSTNPVTGKFYALSGTSPSTLSVFDGTTNALITNVTVGSYASGLIINPVTNTLYVENSGDGTFSIFDGTSNAVTATASDGLTATPYTTGVLALNTVTNTVYVADGTTVSIFQGGSNTVTKSLALSNTNAIVVNPTTGFVYLDQNAGPASHVTILDGTGMIVGTLPVGEVPDNMAINPVTNMIYVANATTSTSTSTITVINGDVNTVSSVSVGALPSAIAANPVNNTIYVANVGDGTVSAIDGRNSMTRSITVGNNPNAVAVNPVSNTIYVFSGSTLSAIDGTTDAVRKINLDAPATALAVDPVTNLVYATVGSNKLAVVNGESGTVTTTTVGNFPVAVAVNPANSNVYVSNSGSNSVSVIDGLTHATSTITGISHPGALAVNPVTNTIYVANTTSSTVSAINGATNAVTYIAVGQNPKAIVVNRVTNRAYVLNSDGAVSIVNGVTNAVISVPVGSGASSLALDHLNNAVYVTNSNAATVSVIDATNNVSTVAVGTTPSTIAYNAANNKVYVANRGNGTVSVIEPAPKVVIPLTPTVQGTVDSGTVSTTNVFQTSNATPSFTVTTSGDYSGTFGYTEMYPAYLPTNQIYYQLDGTAGTWTLASVAGSNRFSITLPVTAQGLHTLYVYASDGAGAASGSNGGTIFNGNSSDISNIVSYPFLVEPTVTTTSVTASPNPVLVGANVTLTATVSPANAASTVVTFTDTAHGLTTTLGTATLTNGVATLSAALSSTGPHVITATYPQTSGYFGSSGSVTVRAYIPDSTTVQVSASPAAIDYGNSTTISVNVVDTPHPGTTAAGTVTINDTVGTTTVTLTSLTLANGAASVGYSPTSPGTHTITVTYAPSDPTLFTAASNTTTFTVNQPQAMVAWVPSTLKIYTGTALGTGVLDATSSIPATIAYSAYVLPSGTPQAVDSSTQLPQGNYGLTAAITPSNTAYAASTFTIPFTVQNMNVFIANAVGSVTSLYNNGGVETAAISGGGLGASVDSSGYVWSINADHNSVSKFTNVGAFAATYSGAGISAATALTVDGNGTVWVTNGGGTVSSLTNSGTPAQSTIGSAANLSSPASITVDPAGSLWIANSGNNTVTEIIGVAAPVTTPLAQSVVNNTVGSRP